MTTSGVISPESLARRRSCTRGSDINRDINSDTLVSLQGVCELASCPVLGSLLRLFCDSSEVVPLFTTIETDVRVAAIFAEPQVHVLGKGWCLGI